MRHVHIERRGNLIDVLCIPGTGLTDAPISEREELRRAARCVRRHLRECAADDLDADYYTYRALVGGQWWTWRGVWWVAEIA